MGRRLCSHIPRRTTSPWVRHLVELSGRAGDCDGMPFHRTTLCTRCWASPGLASQSSRSRQCPSCCLPLGGTLRTQPCGAVGEPLFYGRGGICKSSPIRVSSSGSLCLADPSPTDLEAGSLGKPVELDVPSSCQTPFP